MVAAGWPSRPVTVLRLDALLSLGPLADLDGDGQALSLSEDDEVDGLSRGGGANQINEMILVTYAFAIHFEDDVAVSDARAGAGRIREDVVDERAAGLVQAETQSVGRLQGSGRGRALRYIRW